MSNFTIFFSKMDNLQLVILQESMQVTGLLTTMPVRNTNFNTTNGKYIQMFDIAEVHVHVT